MPCTFGSRLNPDGSETRFIMCRRRGYDEPPPCPFPVDSSPVAADPSPSPLPARFQAGAPFTSRRHGTGRVLGIVLGNPGRIVVRFPDGRRVEYDRATLEAGTLTPFG
jgi:hypothetical protein